MKVETIVSVMSRLKAHQERADAASEQQHGRVATLATAEMALLDKECAEAGMLIIPSMMNIPALYGYVLVVDDAQANP